MKIAGDVVRWLFNSEIFILILSIVLELIREKNKLVLHIWAGLCGLIHFNSDIKIINFKILKIPFNMAKLKAN